MFIVYIRERYFLFLYCVHLRRVLIFFEVEVDVKGGHKGLEERLTIDVLVSFNYNFLVKNISFY